MRVFLGDPAAPQHGYGPMKRCNYDSGKVYGILARLHDAGWLERTRDADPESDGPQRVRYRLRPETVETARPLVSDVFDPLADKQPAGSRRPRPALGGAF